MGGGQGAHTGVRPSLSPAAVSPSPPFPLSCPTVKRSEILPQRCWKKHGRGTNQIMLFSFKMIHKSLLSDVTSAAYENYTRILKKILVIRMPIK